MTDVSITILFNTDEKTAWKLVELVNSKKPDTDKVLSVIKENSPETLLIKQIEVGRPHEIIT